MTVVKMTNTNQILRCEHTADKYGARPTVEDTALASSSIHDNGYVSLLATYGSDQMIVDAARVSFGKGTTSTRSTVALIRYLMRHKHTSPFEQAEVTFYIKAPIFVVRQIIRHRTANVNEYSARYSELSDEFYLPNRTHLHTQSIGNKQGRGAKIDESATDAVQMEFVQAQQNAFDTYQRLLTGHSVARELARVVTSVGTYTELYWKCDLHNFMHFLKLRMDDHAQQEVRDYATLMYECAKPHFPQAFQAWSDYVQHSYTLSAGERKMLHDILQTHVGTNQSWPVNTYGLSDREYTDFKFFLDQLLSK